MDMKPVCTGDRMAVSAASALRGAVDGRATGPSRAGFALYFLRRL